MDEAEQRSTLPFFGHVLAILVTLDVLAWLWAGTVASDIGWMFGSVLFGLLLIVAWLIYLLVWFIRRRRFARHLVVIPVIGLIAIALTFTGLPAKARWAFDEPRLTAAAREVLADPRAEFGDSTDRMIGTQQVSATSKTNGTVRFAIPGGFMSWRQLEYRPNGTQRDQLGARATRLSENWWSVPVDWTA